MTQEGGVSTPARGVITTDGDYYDEMDMESVVLHGQEEEEDLDAAEAGFLRGYLGLGEV